MYLCESDALFPNHFGEVLLMIIVADAGVFVAVSLGVALGVFLGGFLLAIITINRFAAYFASAFNCS